MINLFELMQQAQGGAAMSNLARQFNINMEQTQAIMAAMLPAFMQAMQRRASSPDAFADLFNFTRNNDYQRFFEDAQAAFTGTARDRGNDILGHIFGSKDVSRAFAAQAEAMTGIGQELIKQMLPTIAAMMMGGLAQQQRKMPDWGDIMGDFMRRMTEPQPSDMKEQLDKNALAFGEFIEAGINAQRTQLKAFDNILDKIYGPQSRPDTDK